jgi:hypothetical protein
VAGTLKGAYPKTQLAAWISGTLSPTA